MKYTAVILAAGYGSRIKEITKQPKSLLKINGKSLMERHLGFLESLNFNKIIIVVGYQSEKIINHVQSKNFDTKIEFLANEDYQSKGNAYSMYMGLKMTDPFEDIIIIDADLVYKRSVLYNFINDVYPDSILIGRGSLDDIECAKTLTDENGCVRKTIDKRLVNSQELERYKFVGEAIGMIKFSQKQRNNIIEKCTEFFSNIENITLNWEHLMNYYFTDNCMKTFKEYSKYWIEIDTPEDYRNANILFNGEKLI